MLVVVVLLCTVLMRLAIIGAFAYLLLPRGPRCPHCQAEMARLRNRALELVCPALERRWCLECGWNGVARRAPTGPRPQVPASAPRA